MSTRHSKAAEKFLQDSKMAAWHNETLWMVRAKRDKMSKEVPEWEELRNKACELKLYSNSHLEELLLEFEKNATANGAIVHWAKDADEYCAIVYEILNEHNVRHFIKSKSMLAEECGLNPFLMERGIDVVESDLGERILQLMHLEPSHIVLPAIHIKREQVGELFEKEMGTEKGNFDPTYLTHAARKNLRHLFLNAEAAMTGANFAVASTGDIVVCTNEGNADMGTSCPTLNIAAFGMEKIVPDMEALGVFTRLLARSATGQPITTYTSQYRNPREGGEYHIIIVDNGRSALLAHPDHIKTLNCIRCGACMNTCPVYRRSGGYSYTYFIPGPIGINLGMAHDPEKYYDNLSACSLCMSCSDVCPAKVDLAEQIYKWRQDLDGLGKANTGKKIMSGGMKFLMERPALFNAALWAAPVINGLPRFMNIPGESLKGVYSANEFLTRSNLMKAYLPTSKTPIRTGKKVAVVGGGNVAMDAARSALRLGAETVYIVYRRGMAELPARKEEVEHAEEEGIIFKTLCNPVEIHANDEGFVKSITCIEMELGEPDASGRRRPIEKKGSEFELDVDTVIMSLGTSPNPLIRSTTPGLETNKHGCIVTEGDEGKTSREGVYAGGDAVTGAATVIKAMGAGKAAAKAMDEYIQNQ